MDGAVPRFRFAPAPGGPPDLCDLHTAVFNWGLARALGGDFILRIEDGHSAESAQRGEETAVEMGEALRWLGLDWDEGPEIGGPHAPYFQSQRQDGYREAAEQLLATENAYYEEGADGGRTLSLRVLGAGTTDVADAVRGARRYEAEGLSDPVLVQADGRATVLLAEVVDDHSMGITHVVRPPQDGALTPLQAHLFRTLGWEEPAWIHLPAVEDGEGESLASEIPAETFREKGYLPEAVFNYLLLLGWSPDEEILDKWKVRKRLALEALSPGAVVFEWEALNRINRHYLQRKSDADLTALARPYLEEAYDLMGVNEAWLEQLMGLMRPEMARLADAPAVAEWALTDTFSYSEAAEQALESEAARPALVRLVAELAHIVLLDEPTAASILENLHRHFEAAAVDDPIRAALTGRVEGPPLPQAMGLLGKQRCMNRLATILRA